VLFIEESIKEAVRTPVVGKLEQIKESSAERHRETA